MIVQLSVLKLYKSENVIVLRTDGPMKLLSRISDIASFFYVGIFFSRKSILIKIPSIAKYQRCNICLRGVFEERVYQISS